MKLLLRCCCTLPLLAPLSALGCGSFFYPAPPTLDHYPERLPGKTMRELLRESSPPAQAAATFDQLDRETRDLVAGLTAAPSETVLARIAAALERNRTGDYRKRFANCLYDLRDLLVDGAAAEAAAGDYLDVRLRWMDFDDGSINRPKEDAGLLGVRPPDPPPLPPVPAPKPQEFRDGAAKATPALRPHWQVLLGAAYFREAKFEEAARVFTAVLTEAPKHPRAEIACLMLARCRLEQWRDDSEREPKPESAPELARVADAAFADYLVKYPAGRFALDVPGWRVALARNAGELGRAITLLLEQMDVSGHPEIVRRAARELELVFQETDQNDPPGQLGLDELPLDELAKRPLASLAIVYHLLDSHSRESFSDYFGDDEVALDQLTPMLRLRRSAANFLPKLAVALAKNGGERALRWRPKYLAVLAWASSESGEHRQAVRLCELAGPALAQSDDLRFARAVALQRAGDFPAAREAFETLRRDFPQSPLAGEFEFRLVTVLRDLHEAGLAAAELLQMLSPAEPAPPAAPAEGPANASAKPPSEPPPCLHLDSELEQWRDTLLQFAPLPELERALPAVEKNQASLARFRSILCARHLAAEHFAAARQYAPAATDAPPADAAKDPVHLPFAGDDWTAAVTRLERLTRQVELAPAGGAKAEAEFALASAWATARGRLTLGSIDERLPNAVAAGYAVEAAAREIESRDELSHALPHYLAAAGEPKAGGLAPRALRRANEALRLLAERSPRAAARAFETNAEALSRRCYDRLETEFPASAELRGDNVWWSFRPPAEEPWTREFSGNTEYVAEVAVMRAFNPPPPVEDAANHVDYTDADFEDPLDTAEAWRDRVAEIFAHAAEKDPARLLRELEPLRAACARKIRNPRGAAVLNDIDDLATFLREPGVTAGAITRYASLRLRQVPLDTDFPELAPWPDYVAYLRLARETEYREAAHLPPLERPMLERMREFLEKFPASRKREPAMVRIACVLARTAHGHAGVTDLAGDPPELSRGETLAIDGAKRATRQAALDALAACEREFPAGHYAANLRFWRAALALDARDWTVAIGELTALLDDPRQGDLYLDAALNLGYAFLQLLEDPLERRPILNALRADAAAQRRLWQFLGSSTVGARLRVMEGFLRAQLSGA